LRQLAEDILRLVDHAPPEDQGAALTIALAIWVRRHPAALQTAVLEVVCNKLKSAAAE
jgi:hypothetical protein